ncbi:MAG: hypothetical protein GX102_03370 [Porphyromonadaceae bacterium]|jgi:uncharacterized membrane protein|nr:hypothetical protein [Porphyromonadaceae bacterium]
METEVINNSQESSNPATNTAEEKNSLAIIAYLTIIGLIVAFVMNNEKKEPFASYHIRQSLGLGITGLALGFANIIPILGWIVSILGMFVLLYMWIVGLMNAIRGKQEPMPILGKKYEEWFKSI